jgi:hypothetical protein
MLTWLFLWLQQHRKTASAYASSQTPLSRTSTKKGRYSTSNLEQRPRSLNNGRAMNNPNLSLSIPVTQQVDGATKYIISSQGDVIPQDEENDDDRNSDASSICQSPGWDDITGKKRKKEKKEKERKRKEKEKLELAKLNKLPPKKRLSKMASIMDRSTPAPPVPISTAHPPPVGLTKQAGEHSRKGSVDSGFKSFINVKKAMSTPWRSSYTAPTQSAEDVHTLPASNSNSSGNFIGGLKLRQPEEATSHDIARKMKLDAEGEERKGLLDSDRDTAPKHGDSSSGTSLVESTTRATSTYEESIKTPSQWDAIYAQTATSANASVDKIANHKPMDEETPVAERDVRKSRRAHPPISTSKFFDNDESRYGRNLSQTSIRSSLQSEASRTSSFTSVHTASPNAAMEGSEEPIRGRRSSSYVRHARQQSQDQSIKHLQENYAVSGEATRPRKSESRGRSIFGRSQSKARNSSVARTESIGGSVKDGTLPNPFFVQEEPAGQRHLGQTTGSPTDSTSSHRRKSSFVGSNGVRNLRNAAKAAFSKSTHSLHSGSDSFQSSAEILTATPARSQAGRRVVTPESTSRITPPSKSERVLGEEISPPIVHDFAVPPPPPHKSSRRSLRQMAQRDASKPRTSSQKPGNRDHVDSSAFTDSSEEYSTPDEYSNVTTPMMSTQGSEKEYFSNSEARTHNPRSSSLPKNNIDRPQGPYMMTGAIQSDEAIGSSREDFSRTALPMEMAEDEDRQKTPVPNSDIPPVPQLPSGLNRRPSLSRSASTPELQDLSFLPALKHQPLAPRPKDKSKSKKHKAKAESMSSKTLTNNNTMSEPLAFPDPKTTKSEGSSPTSPHSSQYLRNARLSLPRPLGKPSATRPFSHVPNANSGPGPEPIAKMFVVCCACKYFHDMPSKIYECMTKPDNIVRDTQLGVSGVVSTAVKCPWCGHGMNTKCCAGYAGVVYLREKLH